MTPIKEIDVQKVKERVDGATATVADIRDPASYQSSRIPNAVHLTDDNVLRFLSDTDKEKPLALYCYHGISSQGAAAYFTGQGLKEVYSMAGGFEGWMMAFSGSVEAS